MATTGRNDEPDDLKENEAAARGRRRFVPSRNVVLAVAGVLVLLAGAVYATKPQWQPWWYAATICGGDLSGSDLADVLPEKRLEARKDEMDGKGGELKCGVDGDRGRYALIVEATSVPQEVEQKLSLMFPIASEPSSPFPKEIPGFRSVYGPTILQVCPSLDRDSHGRRIRLLTTVRASEDNTAAALRIAVSMANKASEKLGCGAKPLPLPKHTQSEEPPAVPLKDAVGTMCGWLTDAPLPKNASGQPWRVAIPADDHAPITSCQLKDGKNNRPVAEFSGWYGEWTDKPFSDLLRFNVFNTNELDSQGPLMSEDLGRTTARCDGEPANFRAFTFQEDRKQSITGRDLRALLVAFTQDQAKRRGCTSVSLPSEEIRKSRQR